MIENLKNKLNSGTPDEFRRALLGPDSLLCQAMRSLRVDVNVESQNRDDSLNDLANLLNEQFKLEVDKPGGQNKSVLLDILSISQDIGESDDNFKERFMKAIAPLTAVYYSLRAAKSISNSDKDGRLNLQLQQLFDSLHSGFGFDAPDNGRVRFSNEGNASGKSTGVAGHLEQLKENQHPAVYWMASDLLDRWVSREKHDLKKTRAASTTIVGAAKGNEKAHLFTLTVELIESAKGPIYPDLFYVGLTDVSEVTKHFDDVWKVSGLGQWFRCRWRIEFNDEKRRSTEVVHTTDKHIRALGGNSAQAACLVAILAACGDPYLMKTINAVNDFPAPEKIALDVAVSAAVDCDQKPNQTVKERSLSRVGSVPQKLGKTRSVLDFLVLFADEQKTDEIKDLINTRKKYDNSTTADSADKPVGVETAMTVENVLDLLLESNQYLGAYRETINDAWLKQWQVNTGRFPGGPEAIPDDPDFENQPTPDSEEQTEQQEAQP